ncbi:hypothetical protein DFH09DRAFT_1300029 [Mycena vulgaris]|nr:hypothetical protein DFH09DRAFT_1300029 [Mycena vulgaris]
MGVVMTARAASSSSTSAFPSNAATPGIETIADYISTATTSQALSELLSLIFAASSKGLPALTAQLDLSNSMGLLLLLRRTITRAVAQDMDEAERRYFWPREVWAGERYGGGFVGISNGEDGERGEALSAQKQLARLPPPQHHSSRHPPACATRPTHSTLSATRPTRSIDYLRLLKYHAASRTSAAAFLATLELCFGNGCGAWKRGGVHPLREVSPRGGGAALLRAAVTTTASSRVGAALRRGRVSLHCCDIPAAAWRPGVCVGAALQCRCGPAASSRGVAARGATAVRLGVAAGGVGASASKRRDITTLLRGICPFLSRLSPAPHLVVLLRIALRPAVRILSRRSYAPASLACSTRAASLAHPTRFSPRRYCGQDFQVSRSHDGSASNYVALTVE